MVGDNINWSCRAFKIVVPGPKSLMDSEELLVISVVVELWSRQSLGIVGDRSNLLIRTTNGEYNGSKNCLHICLFCIKSS